MNFDQTVPVNPQSYHFSIYKPTQIKNQQLFIEHSSEGLKLSTKSNEGVVCTIKKYMIEGLPKLNFVPKEFFEQCYARLVQVGSDYKVYFSLPIHGGMFQLNNELAIPVNNVPRNALEITQCYNFPPVANRVALLQRTAHYTLNDVTQYMITGAKAMSIAYLSGMSLKDAGPALTDAKYKYTSMVTDTAGNFVVMYGGIQKIIQQHAHASDYANLGRLPDSLRALQTAQTYANENLAACDAILLQTEGCCSSVKSCGVHLNAIDVELVAAENALAQLNAELRQVDNEINQCEGRIRESINGMERSQRPRFLRALAYRVIFKRKPTPGNPQVAATHEQNRQHYYALLLQKQQIQLQKIEAITRVNNRVAQLAGDFGTDTLSARRAVSMALVGLDEVITAVHYYQNFMRQIREATDTAIESLNNLIEIGRALGFDQNIPLTAQQQQVVNRDFMDSVYSWVSLHKFIGDCIQRLEYCQTQVHDALTLRALTPEERQNAARQELQDLQTVINNRRSKKNEQVIEAQEYVNNPDRGNQLIGGQNNPLEAD